MSNFTTPSRVSLSQLSDDALVQLDIVFHHISVSISKLAAISSVQTEFIPHPLDQTTTMRNPFFLASVQPSAPNAPQSTHYATSRSKLIASTVTAEVKHDLTSYTIAMQTLREMVNLLNKLCTESSSYSTTTTLPDLTTIDIRDITPETITSFKQNVLTSILPQVPSLRPESTFDSEDEYIEHLRIVRKQLYDQVQHQNQTIASLTQQATSLHQSLAMYRAQ